MSKAKPLAAKRYLVVGDVAHYLYESDGDHYRTKCGEIGRGGTKVISVGKPATKTMCEKCRRACQHSTTVLDESGVPQEYVPAIRVIKSKAQR